MRQRPETYADPPAGRLGVVISHPATRRYAFAFAGYAIATLIIFFPLIRHLNGAVLWQPGDQSSTARDMWAAEQQGESPFSLHPGQSGIRTPGAVAGARPADRERG